LVNDQRDAQILFYVFISIYNSLHISSTSRSSSGETNCINAASGNSHSMLVAEMCARWSFTKNHYMMHGQQNVKFYIRCISNFCKTFVEDLVCLLRPLQVSEIQP